ncbi:MAG: glutamine--tRNA ligase [Acidobacteria bacterium]|nr:MAG: glutamine--tRNA ligase [Acidobacteriota bacterium]
MDSDAGTSAPVAPLDFVREIVAEDMRTGKHGGRVHTRFPPEPNGYLHIGHAKAICLDFGVATEFGGACNLRLDDTNPVKETQEYVDQIMEDIRWLGFDWDDRLYHASDYFEQLYQWAEQLIRAGKAYVDELTADEMRDYRGTLTEPGRESPYRNRPSEESLDLFRRMRAGEFDDGAKTLRAKIDMASGNVNLRDPVMYRIRKTPHQRTGDTWCIYPMYDWAHGQSDSIEGVTHSLCTLEYEDHRPLYDWYLDALGIYHPRQIESGLRRRGVPPEAVRDFVKRIGVAKANSVVDVAMFDFSVREVLNKMAWRRMAVLRPLKVVIENYAEGRTEDVEAINNPEDPNAGSRRIPFSRVLYIEQDDFMETPPKKFFRLSPGNEVRLRYAYILKCERAVHDASGTITELRCTYDPESLNGSTASRRVKGTIHWVSADHAVDAEVRLYDRLFTSEDPGEGGRDPLEDLNPDSLERVTGAKVEPSLASAPAGDRCQFERQGYFCVDPDSRAGTPVFNRTVTLKDSWAKIQKRT